MWWVEAYSSCTVTGVVAPEAITLTAPAKGTVMVSSGATAMPVYAVAFSRGRTPIVEEDRDARGSDLRALSSPKLKTERLFDALLPDGYWQTLMHSSVEHLHGPAEIPYDENELVVLCRVRDGESLVSAFIEHHLSLGVWIREMDNVVSNPKIPAMRSGIRKTLFNIHQALTKHPLVFLDDELEPLHNGSHAIKNARVADFSCVFFTTRSSACDRRRSMPFGKAKVLRAPEKYGKALQVLDHNPELWIKQNASRELESVEGLVDIGFLHVSEDYMNWVAKEKK